MQNNFSLLSLVVFSALTSGLVARPHCHFPHLAPVLNMASLTPQLAQSLTAADSGTAKVAVKTKINYGFWMQGTIAAVFVVAVAALVVNHHTALTAEVAKAEAAWKEAKAAATTATTVHEAAETAWNQAIAEGRVAIKAQEAAEAELNMASQAVAEAELQVEKIKEINASTGKPSLATVQALAALETAENLVERKKIPVRETTALVQETNEVFENASKVRGGTAEQAMRAQFTEMRAKKALKKLAN